MSDQLTRRQILARLGVGTAVAWSAPVLATISSPAGAVGQGAACRDLAKDGLGSCSVCGDTFCEPDPSSGFCFCQIRVQGGCCFCADLAIGSGCPDLQPCQRDNQCPASWRCVYSCCAVSPPNKGVCLPPCGLAQSTTLTLGLQTATNNGQWYRDLVAARSAN